MQDKIDIINKEIKELIKKVTDISGLEKLKCRVFGKEGMITSLQKIIGALDNNEKPVIGKRLNEVKQEIELIIKEKKEELSAEAEEERLSKAPRYDFTLKTNNPLGTYHPITLIERELVEYFRSMGFEVEEGREVESEYNNFEAVNVPKYHPARDMQDTFWLENGDLLKTHTSAAQNRIMKKYSAPLKTIFPGRCFRNEELDSSHENTFFQLEGMMIDENISVANLIYFMKGMLSSVFKKDIKVRLRPGYFPFVEPGFELDASCMYCNQEGCKVCKQSGWIELCPCGIIHPNVLKMGGIDEEKYSGFAFGLGLSRLAMMKYKIPDLRILNSCDLRALKQIDIN